MQPLGFDVMAAPAFQRREPVERMDELEVVRPADALNEIEAAAVQLLGVGKVVLQIADLIGEVGQRVADVDVLRSELAVVAKSSARRSVSSASANRPCRRRLVVSPWRSRSCCSGRAPVRCENREGLAVPRLELLVVRGDEAQLVHRFRDFRGIGREDAAANVEHLLNHDPVRAIAFATAAIHPRELEQRLRQRRPIRQRAADRDRAFEQARSPRSKSPRLCCMPPMTPRSRACTAG